MILAIDPSFTGTGLALLDAEGIPIVTKRVTHRGVCYDSIVNNHDACISICKSIDSLIESSESPIHVICEYPAFATRSGAYLAILNGFIGLSLRMNPLVLSITWVGPKHCDSFIKNKTHSKTFIVNYCKTHGWISKRTSHDECTAIVLGKLLLAIQANEWKNSYFTWHRDALS